MVFVLNILKSLLATYIYNNALLSIIGTSKIIFDKNGELKKLQEYALNKFSKPLPALEKEDAR